MKRVGLIAGAFDLIHPGYIRMFKEAKQVCDHLIVALQDDPTLDRPYKLKPIQTWNERKEILSSIVYVDEILSYSTESDLLELLKETKFDLRILGADYEGKSYTGSELGHNTHYCQRSHGYSTTALKKKIHDSVCNSKSLESRFNKSRKKIYVFDIDGTLVTDTQGDYDKVQPIKKSIERVNSLFDEGHKIILMTARGASSKIDHTELTKKQMKDFGVKFHELIMHKKPTADFFVDDKAINVNDWLEMDDA